MAIKEKEILVPDIGGATDVEVIEVAIKAGETIAKDDTLITLESDKAAMDVPAEEAGKITKVKVKVGDKVSAGSVIATLESKADDKSAQAVAAPKKTMVEETAPVEAPKATVASTVKTMPIHSESDTGLPSRDSYAGPAVRRLAHEFNIDLAQITGSGDKGRITKQDVQDHIKHRLQTGGGVAGLPEMPEIDFSQFGEVETQALTRINKLTAKNMQRNWLTVPHVTQFEEADITEMEAFRQVNKAKAEKKGYKLTPLVFIMKAVVAALKAYPRFNSSLAAGAEHLIIKHYYHLGIAIDTPTGLVVPVVRNVDQKSLFELAHELSELSQKARDGKLRSDDLKGGCFTISSLGGIGGTAFTPIVNAPEVAILGVSKAKMKPIYDGKTFIPRLMLPLSLSYDHRVIDGALAARFAVSLAQYLTDIRQLLL